MLKQTDFIDIFPWNDNFNTGILKIDTQHRALVDLLNQLANQATFQTHPQEINSILQQLLDYASMHFQSEKEIWHQYLPEDSLEIDHNKEHDNFINQVNKLKENSHKKPFTHVIEEIISFLTHWLAIHILENDRHMAMVVCAMQSGVPIEAAKKLAEQQMGGSTKTLINVILSIYQNLSKNSLSLIRKIGEQKILENALINSEEKLLLFIKNAPASLAMLDLNMNYIAISPRWQSDFNLTNQEIIGQSHYKVFPNISDKHKSINRRAINGETITHEGDYFKLNNDTTLWIRWEVRPWQDLEGNIGGLVMFTEDITKIKKTEVAYQQMANTLIKAQKIANIGNWSYQLKDGKMDCSDQIYKIFGRDQTLEPITLNPLISWIHPDDRPLLTAFQHEVHSIEAKKPRNLSSPVFRLVRPGGEIRWIEITAESEFNDTGNSTHCFGTAQDITERKHSETTLSKLTLAVEQVSNAIFITDLNGTIEHINKAFTQITGYTAHEVVGKNPRILNSGKNPASTYKEMWTQLSQGKEWRGELINKDKFGNEYIEASLMSPVYDNTGKVTNYLAIKENVTEKRQAEERIKQLAYYDQLTGLPNRDQLNQRFEYTLGLAERNGTPFSLMFLDLDHFKNINDTLGHSIGDKVLMEAAKRLKSALRENDTLSRTGGDEFILLLPDTNEDGSRDVAIKLLQLMSRPCQIDQHQLVSTLSIGIAMYPEDGKDFETLSSNADTAMYRVKNDSRNGYCFFTEQMQALSARSLKLTNALHYALKNNELLLHYQPQLSINGEHIIGAEALLRWHHPEMGMVPPVEFIHIAEISGQILEIGEWVIRTAVNQLKKWLDDGLPPFVIAVNLSAVQFRHPNLPEMVSQILDEAQLPHKYLELELTEAVTMDCPDKAITIMNNCHDLGIHMSIDDFGTGYSSLSYLKKFKAYKLKIDRSFVTDIKHDPDDKAIVLAIINLAKSLDMLTIAEGVETADQLAFLQRHGCDEAQGFYFSKPLTAHEFESYALTIDKKTAQ